ncbi:MAG: hypothetical protein E5X51_10395 [Mesorhizobium sp.]|nr:MAG: hypothetical protein E5X51_10395 [Mesorhizobium sp.]
MRGVPAWHRRHSVQHPSSVLALRANPPSPTRGEGRIQQPKEKQNVLCRWFRTCRAQGEARCL